MKTCLFILFALSVINTATAQKFEFGLDGGTTFNTLPFNMSMSWASQACSGLKPSGSNFTEGLKALYNYKKYQLGISIYKEQLSFYGTFPNPYVYPQMPVYWTGTVLLGHPLYYSKLFLNRKVVLGHLQLYYGLSIAYNVIKSANFQDGEGIIDFKGHKWTWANSKTYGAGLQFGATYFLSKHIGINSELACDYMYYHLIPMGTNSNIVTIPAVIGLRYRF